MSRLFRYWKLVTLKKILYLPRVLTAKEKGLFSGLFLIAIVSGILFFGRIYIRTTTAVPAISGAYTEGILGNPRIINPLFASRDSERDLARLIYSSLLAYDGEGRIINDLAEKYEVSEDGKIYTVTLKKNALWHDGVPLTADDAAFTVHVIQNAQYKSPLRPNWQGVNVEVLDPRTIRFILRSPYAPFIENLTVGIIPKHIWEKITPEQTLLHEQALKPIGSGPYQFSALRQETDGTISWYTLARNPHYYREGPNLKEITFDFFHNEDDMMNAVHIGKIDGYGPVSEKFIAHLNKNISTAMSAEMPRIFGMFFNDQHADALKDKAVRQAISLAINRDEITKNVVSGGAIPYAFPLPSFLKLHNNNAPPDAYNPDKAKQILASAGWSDSNNDGILDKPAKNKAKTGERTDLAFTLTTSDWPDLLHSAEVIKNELHAVGINITIESLPFSELESKAIRPRNFQILLFGEVFGFEPDPFPFWHSSQIKDPGLNIALYTSKKADRLLEDARKTNDTEERRKKYADFETIMANDIPAVFLYSQTFLYLLPSDMHGVNLQRISLPSDRFNGINTWYRETKRVFK